MSLQIAVSLSTPFMNELTAEQTAVSSEQGATQSGIADFARLLAERSARVEAAPSPSNAAKHANDTPELLGTSPKWWLHGDVVSQWLMPPAQSSQAETPPIPAFAEGAGNLEPVGAEGEREFSAPVRSSEIEPADHLERRLIAPLADKPAAPAPYAMGDSVSDVRPDTDLHKMAQQEAAPVAVAFSAAGIFELLGGQITPFHEMATSDSHIFGRAPVQMANVRFIDAGPAAISNHPTVTDEVAYSARLPIFFGRTVTAARGVVRNAGSSEAEVTSTPNMLSPETNEVVFLGDASEESPAVEPPIRNMPRLAAGHAQRAELLTSFLPICVTLYSMNDGIKLTIRMANGKSGTDPGEFSSAAAKMIRAEGYGLRGVTINGNREEATWRNQ